MGKLNIELFKKVRNRIAEIPESFNQDSWVEESQRSPCGTTACLAGEAIICAAPSIAEGIEELKRLDRSVDGCAVPRAAASLLGLEGDFAEYAFSDDPEDAGETIIFDGDADGWPERFRERFRAGDEAGAAVTYLDHIIETGQVLE